MGLRGFPLVVTVAALLLAGCVADGTDTTGVPVTPGVPAIDSATDLETTTTSTSLPVLVSLTQVCGGSVTEDGPAADDVAVSQPERPEGSYMTAVTVMDSGLVAGGVVYPADAETTDAAVWTSLDGRAWTRVEDEAGVLGDASSATGVPGDQVINDVVGGSLAWLRWGQTVSCSNTTRRSGSRTMDWCGNGCPMMPTCSVGRVISSCTPWFRRLVRLSSLVSRPAKRQLGCRKTGRNGRDPR